MMLIYLQIILLLLFVPVRLSYGQTKSVDLAEWKSLLHLNLKSSDVVSSEWYLSKERTPESELESFEVSNNGCEFPLRQNFVNELRNSKFDFSKCEDLSVFYKELDTNNISILLTSEFYNSPASTYGHISLVFHNGPIPDLNSEVIHYSAVQKQAADFIYSLSGLSGGLYGNFFKEKFFKKYYEYSLVEQRKIFLWKLKLNKEQKTRLIFHLYELSKARFRYYFLSDNCSYQIAKVLGITYKLNIDEKLIFLPSNTVNIFKDYIESPSTILPLREKVVRAVSDLKSSQYNVYESYLSEQATSPNLKIDEKLACAIRLTSSLNFLEKKVVMNNYSDIQNNVYCKIDNDFLVDRGGPVRLDQINKRASVGYGYSKVNKSYILFHFRPTAKDTEDFQSFKENSVFNILNTELEIHKTIKVNRIDIFSLRKNSSLGTLFFDPSWSINISINKSNYWSRLSPSFDFSLGNNINYFSSFYYFVGPTLEYINSKKVYPGLFIELNNNVEIGKVKLNSKFLYKRYLNYNYTRFEFKVLRDYGVLNPYVGAAIDRDNKYFAGLNFYF